MMQVANSVSQEGYGRIEGHLNQRGIPYTLIGDSTYFRDPNDLPLELMILQA